MFEVAYLDVLYTAIKTKQLFAIVLYVQTYIIALSPIYVFMENVTYTQFCGGSELLSGPSGGL